MSAICNESYFQWTLYQIRCPLFLGHSARMALEELAYPTAKEAQTSIIFEMHSRGFFLTFYVSVQNPLLLEKPKRILD